jgi:hypothetical protein
MTTTIVSDATAALCRLSPEHMRAASDDELCDLVYLCSHWQLTIGNELVRRYRAAHEARIAARTAAALKSLTPATA